MYLSSQLFFKTPHKTLKFKLKIAVAADKIYKQTKQNGVFSTDMHGKNHVYPQCTNYASAV